MKVFISFQLKSIVFLLSMCNVAFILFMILPVWLFCILQKDSVPCVCSLCTQSVLSCNWKFLIDP